MPEHELQEEEFSFKSLFVPFTTLKAIHWLVFIGLIVFFNSLFNGFVLEDRAEVVRNLSVHSISGISNSFIHQVGGQETITYYRPLLFTFYTILYTLFQGNTFPYHLVQLSFQIANAILIFLILKKYLKTGIAFFLSVLFLVHPMNEESVVWITDLQEVLYLFFGLLAVYFVQKYEKGIKYIAFANICLLLSFFSKETGILFFLVTLLYVYLFKRNKLLLHIISSFGAGSIYIILRLISQTPLQKQPLVPIMNLNFMERMINVPAIIFYYIKTLFYPKDLVVYHSWIIQNTNFDTFYLPLILDLVFFIILFLGCYFVWRRHEKRKIIFFFSIWFLSGLIFHLQLFPLDFTVADHFFLFAFIGLIALFGFIIQDIKFNRQLKRITILLGIILLCILSVRTMVRNTNWSDQMTILSHDEKVAGNDYLLELVYSTELIQNNDKSAMVHIQKALSLYPDSWLAWNSLGVLYFQKGDFVDAKKAYTKSISIEKSFGAYENMGLLLLKQGDLKTAKEFIQNANALFPTSWKLWYYRVIVEYKTGNDDNALIAAKYYYLLNPTTQSYNIYTALSQKRPINIAL